MLTDAVRFDPAQMRAFVDAGWWNDDTLSAWLRAHAHVAPERPAIVGPTATISYGELYDQVQRLAAAFFDLGVRKGDVIAVQLPNIPAFLLIRRLVSSDFQPAPPASLSGIALLLWDA